MWRTQYKHEVVSSNKHVALSLELLLWDVEVCVWSSRKEICHLRFVEDLSQNDSEQIWFVFVCNDISSCWMYSARSSILVECFLVTCFSWYRVILKIAEMIFDASTRYLMLVFLLTHIFFLYFTFYIAISPFLFLFYVSNIWTCTRYSLQCMYSCQIT